MLRLWGRTSSVNVQKVLMCLTELGAAYERIDAGLQFGVVGDSAYKALNPNSLVPTIEDDDFVLWESNSIVRYLCATRSAGCSTPADPRARADLERWMDWQLSVLHGPIASLFWGLVRSPGSRPDEEIAASRAKAEAATEILEGRLADAPWISGAEIGAADFAIAPYLHRWLNVPMQRPKRPHVEAYYSRVMARPSGSEVLLLPMT